MTYASLALALNPLYILPIQWKIAYIITNIPPIIPNITSNFGVYIMTLANKLDPLILI